MTDARSTATGRSDATPNANKPGALRPREAAAYLGIGQTKLWQMTQPRGPIPCARVGVAVIYPVALLDAWLLAEAKKGAQS